MIVDSLAVIVKLNVISIRVSCDSVTLSNVHDVGTVEQKENRIQDAPLWDTAQDG